MRAVLAGIDVFKRAPLALVPLSIEGLVVALLMLFGALPIQATSILAGGSFPLDVYFDMKHLLAFSHGWVMFAVLAALSVVVRGGVLATTLWLAEDATGNLLVVWRRAMRLCIAAAAAFLPVAGMFVAGVGTRYAPFLWVAAPVGLAVGVSFVRKGVRLDVGGRGPRPSGMPEVWGFLTYTYVVCGFGAALSSLANVNGFLAALIAVFLGPLHALFLLGWRQKARLETYPGGGTVALAVTVLLAGALAGGTFYDRFIRSAPPVARATNSGELLILGGVDSTSRSGALFNFDSRSVGYPTSRVDLLSYSRSASYRAVHTHRDLSDVADIVAKQTDDEPDANLLGHSQAALVLDRLLAANAADFGYAAMFAPSPPHPPRLSFPEPGDRGRGKPGGDFIRALSYIMESLGLNGFEIDARSSPTNLGPVVVTDSTIPRLSIWALADSAWLDRDWRRPGETNIVAVTDHVGVTNNGRAIRLVSDFLAGNSVADDEASWRGALVPLIRYAFEPWRPA